MIPVLMPLVLGAISLLPADPPAPIADRNAFALDLFRRVAREDGSGNVVLSPHGVTRVMAMAAEGATGATADEIRKAARLPTSPRALEAIDPGRPRTRSGLNVGVAANGGYGVKVEAVPSGSIAERAGLAAGDLILSVDDRPVRAVERFRDALDIADRRGPARLKVYVFNSGQVRDIALMPETIESPSALSVRDAAFVQGGLAVGPKFLSALEGSFRAAVVPIDFASGPASAAREIARWVDSAGGDLPRPDLSGLDPSTRLVLVDAVRFEADWRAPFPAESPSSFTRPDGKRSDVPTLARIGRYAVAPMADGSAAVEIPYADPSFSFLVVLPPAKSSPRAMLAKWDAATIEAMRKLLKPGRVDLSLPRFRVDSARSLNAALADLGVKRAFGPRADFSAMFPGRDPSKGPIALGAVAQAAYLEVTPRGTKAGAVTTAAAVALDAEDEPVPFHADRPFAFLLIARASGLIVFEGIVEDPASGR